MKAYLVEDENRYEDYCTVVFAETRGKAKQAAIYTDTCCDSEFTDIRAIRKPELDKYYRGYSEMNWDDDKDRVAMVRYAGMRCSDEVLHCDCIICPAKEYCDRYEYELEDLKESEGWNEM